MIQAAIRELRGGRRGHFAQPLWRVGEILAWGEDRVERLVDRYVKRDEILRDRVRRLNAAGGTEQKQKPQNRLQNSGGDSG